MVNKVGLTLEDLENIYKILDGNVSRTLNHGDMSEYHINVMHRKIVQDAIDELKRS